MSFLLICDTSDSIVVCGYAYFTLIWYWVAIPCYVVVLVALMKYRKKNDLKPAFFKLMFSIGLVDMVMMTNVYIAKMLYIFGWHWVHDIFKLVGHPAVRITYFLGIACFICEAFHITAIGVNRMTAMVFPFKHKVIWNSQRVKWITICGWLSAAIIGGPLLTPLVNVQVAEIENSSQVYIAWEMQKPLAAVVLITGFSAFAVGITVPILYLITFYAAYKRYKKQKKNTTKNDNGREELNKGIKMVVAGFAVSLPLLVQIISAVIWQVAAKFGYKWGDFFIVAFGISNDIYGGLNPFVLVAFSKSVVRKYVKRLFGYNNNVTAVVSIK